MDEDSWDVHDGIFAGLACRERRREERKTRPLTNIEKRGREEDETDGWLRDLGGQRWAETGRQAQASEPTE